MGLSKRSTTVVSHLSNLSMLPKLEVLPPFGAGSKAGASGIWAADVPAIKRSFQLLEGLSMVRERKGLDEWPFFIFNFCSLFLAEPKCAISLCRVLSVSSLRVYVRPGPQEYSCYVQRNN